MSGEQDMRRMGGLRKKLPWTYWTMVAGALAIAGIPPFAGFFSKDEMLWKAWETLHPVLWVMGGVTAAMTAFYMFRLIYLTFHGEFRGTEEQRHHLHESPLVMTVPLAILAVLSLVGGFIDVPGALGGSHGLDRWLAPTVATATAHGWEADNTVTINEMADAAAHGAVHATDPREYVFMLIRVGISLGGISPRWSSTCTGASCPRASRRHPGPSIRCSSASTGWTSSTTRPSCAPTTGCATSSRPSTSGSWTGW
jgi:NADH:ubiquinone oxidoreductase subunit 5 (subunit L)/multisubunit Na+/H+ antiporter MnhA subunit